MKRIIIVALIILGLATPSYAVNIIDKILCKKVVLRNNNGTVILVNRLTQRVESVMSGGRSFPLTDELKKQFQVVYDAQRTQEQ